MSKYFTKFNPLNKNSSFWDSKYKYAVVFANRKTPKEEFLLCYDKKEVTKKQKECVKLKFVVIQNFIKLIS